LPAYNALCNASACLALAAYKHGWLGSSAAYLSRPSWRQWLSAWLANGNGWLAWPISVGGRPASSCQLANLLGWLVAILTQILYGYGSALAGCLGVAGGVWLAGCSASMAGWRGLAKCSLSWLTNVYQ